MIETVPAWRFVGGIEVAIVVEELHAIITYAIAVDQLMIDVVLSLPLDLCYQFRLLAILDTFTADIVTEYIRSFLINTLLFLLHFIFGAIYFLYESQLRLRGAYPP